MRAMPATSVSVSAGWSRVNARITVRPLASPPMASRRSGVLWRRGIPEVYFDMRRSKSAADAHLTRGGGRVQHVRQSNLFSIFETRIRAPGAARNENRFSGREAVRDLGVE